MGGLPEPSWTQGGTCRVVGPAGWSLPYIPYPREEEVTLKFEMGDRREKEREGGRKS